MPTNEIETKAMIQACAAFYRAITELDNVARPHGSRVELEREAYKATVILRKTLDAELRNWNDGSFDPEDNGPRIAECAGNGSGKWADWTTNATRTSCDVYTVDASGLCPDCLVAKTKYDAVEASK